jgi:hypothetical protein
MALGAHWCSQSSAKGINDGRETTHSLFRSLEAKLHKLLRVVSK